MGYAQTTYYVASSGSDSNNGRASDAPFQSINKINSLALQPGDQILFRRGDTFRGTLQITQSGSSMSPIVIDAYGAGNKPVLAGSSLVSNWTNIGNNLWQATCSACGDRVTGVYRNNAALPLGRYPNLDVSNKGYLTVQSHSGRSSLTSQQALITNWTGAEAVFRPVNWILNRSIIRGQSGNTLQLDGSGNFNVSDNWGYFIQNHPSTLDQVGEWYYNPATKTIQLFDNQANPNNSSITATTRAQSIVLTSVAYITIRNLQLAQSVATGILATNTSNLVFSSNDVVQSGEDGISLQGSGSQILMEGNLIEDANNNGLIIGAYQNFTFRGNTVQKIGLLPGRGKSGDGTYIGILMATTANTLFENNIIDNIGYNGITFSTSTTIQHNQVSNFCMTKSDGSGLYIWNGNQQVMANMHLLSNVVFNGIGAPEGAPSDQPAEANGIYLDDCTTNIEVANNTVYNCAGMGIYFHGTSNSKLTGNTLFNNSEAQFVIRNVNGCPPQTNVIKGNQFVSRLATQPTAKYEASSVAEVANFGQFDNNVYARPFEDVNKIHVYYGNVTGGDGYLVSSVAEPIRA
ncbi:right-handed parallel beta-helix repeat-containing protein [Spirosoma foliorum]|uniref:Right-handed parallel beta-helix repeat-containing protein n=1 Tax=Spirosoma foliorum TaxID=2710596 RepID=A0A7G5H1D6_9BACT|nr:right-handed parallel beta-helix repeat-containing protein [Spirosoma foliorum]QMW04928.1 right-handed parallel beta-helix repeat-containing protein [Spirosoma foliorum]